ncbi:ubiquitin system component Cue protein [Tasmannia lanceolata]|uniref:ubiquitin system component Cue protein n=1 Tax=Tasmannia lanceolata TaxID=3420 RepID=UPI004064B7DB
MSSRSSNRRDGNKGFSKTQKKFVPKTENSSNETLSNHSFTRSLRESSSKIDGLSASSSSSSDSARVRLGDNSNWASRKQGGNFVNYLPQDEAVAVGLGVEDGGLDAVESQRVVDLLNRELSRLLKMGPRDFWKEVAGDGTLHEFLDSYLQFRSRWYDFPHHGVKGIVAGVIVEEFELSRRVFMILYRISSNKDPGARSSDSLTAKDHEAFLQETKLLDLPKLLDICAIYGRDNEELTRLLVTNVMTAQPMLLENLTAVVSHFLIIVHTMYQRCNSSLEVLISSGGHEDHGHGRLLADFLEVMDFINDAIASLDAFVDAYKLAAIYFTSPVEMRSGSEDLLNTLARLHDSLLPSLQRGFALICAPRVDGTQNPFGGTLSNVALSLKMLSLRIVKFGWKLLDLCYLSDDLSEGINPLLTATKMLPSKVEDPVIRGDILVQTFREINGGVSSHPLKNQSSGTFLQNIEKNYKMLSRLDNLRTNGWIFMDDEQFQYLALITTPISSMDREKEPNVPISSRSDRVQMDEDTAISESKISQIKDLFPDYGKGFLSACLEVYNQNPEEVIQRILEGTLHKDLLSLDTSLEKAPVSQLKSASLSRNDKGKGTLIEPAYPSGNDKGKGQLVEPLTTPSLNVGPVVGDRDGNGPSASSSSTYGRYVRKSKGNLPEPEILDTRDVKDSLRTVFLASQYDYEDEYDDSFDDLGLSVEESGFEEAENFGSLPDKSSRREMESSAKNSSSRWNSQNPQFYVKDGKNYSYKVSGSIAASNAREAAVINQTQKGLIHGLGRGGNIPHGSRQMPVDFHEQDNQTSDVPEIRGIGNSSIEQDNQASHVPETGGRGNSNSRGRGRGRGAGNHYRKDRAMRKHFTGLSGF